MNPKISFIKKEPFPAITICNMNQAQYSKVKNIDVNSLDYAMLQRMCFQKEKFASFLHKNPPPAKNNSFANFIVKHTQSCSEMLVSCKFGDVYTTCSDLFREVLYDEGMCCTFNAVHPHLLYKNEYFIVRDYTSLDVDSTIPLDWSPDKGYPKKLPKYFYPRMTPGDGLINGFKILLNGDYDNYYCSSTNGPGFKVLLHSPIDTPYIKETALAVSLGHQTNVRVTFLKEETAENLRTSAKPKDRQCYFGDEYPLQSFRYYTKLNCELECDSEFMLRKCNCIPHYMPLLSNNATICHVRHFDCLVKTEHLYNDATRQKCKNKCLSNCNDLIYEPKTFPSMLANDGFVIRSPYLRNMSKENLQKYATLNIFFPQRYFRGTIKNPYMRLTEFLSQTGGILCLLTGFSVISLVEVAYFLILKPFIYMCCKIFHKSSVDVLEDNSTLDYEIPEYPNPYAPPNVFVTTTHFQPCICKNMEQLHYLH